MGTSISQGSPPRNSWRAVSTAYQNESFGPNLLTALVWRASGTDPQNDMATLLAQGTVTECLGIALRSPDAATAASQAAREIARQRASSLGTDIARRAVVECFDTGDRVRGFAESLFAEATNYLVSRDVSPLVGPTGRLRTVGDVTNLKDAIIAAVRVAVRESGDPPPPTTPEAWPRYVKRVVGRLRQ